MVNIFGTLTYVIIIVGFIVAILWGLASINVEEYTQGVCTFPPHVCDFAARVGFPKGWMSEDKLLWYGILPISGVWLIIYGFLTTIGIFGRGRKGYYALLSFFIAFSTIPLGLFVIFVATLFAIMGAYATFMFAALFFIGIAFYFIFKVSGWKTEKIGTEMFDKQIEAKKREFDLYGKEEKEAEEELEKLREKVLKGKMTPADATQRALELETRRIRAKKAKESARVSIPSLIEDKKKFEKQLKEMEKIEKEA